MSLEVGRWLADIHWLNQMSVVSFGWGDWWLGQLGSPPIDHPGLFSRQSRGRRGSPHTHKETRVLVADILLAKVTVLEFPTHRNKGMKNWPQLLND